MTLVNVFSLTLVEWLIVILVILVSLHSKFELIQNSKLVIEQLLIVAFFVISPAFMLFALNAICMISWNFRVKSSTKSGADRD